MSTPNGSMESQLEQRLEELRAEFEKGQKQLAELESQADSLRSTLLRIAGGIQVLSEELDKAHAPSDLDEA